MFLIYRLMALSLQRSDCWKQYLEYDRSLIKLENCSQRIEFIEQCQNADIIPRFLKFRIPKNGCFEPTVVHNFQLKLLKQELNKAEKTKVRHLNNVHQKRVALKLLMPPKLIPSVAFFTRQNVKTTRATVKSTHTKKLKMLSSEQNRPLFEVHDTVKLCDLDIQPPRYVLDTLALGPRNAVLDKFNEKDVLAEIDSLLAHCSQTGTSNDIMNNINVATFKYIKACSSQKSPRNLVATQKFLKEHDLLAVPFDKGVGICLMKKDTCKKKLNDILNLDQFVKVVKTRKNGKEIIIKEQERINEELDVLKGRGEISEINDGIEIERRSTCSSIWLG